MKKSSLDSVRIWIFSYIRVKSKVNVFYWTHERVNVKCTNYTKCSISAKKHLRLPRAARGLRRSGENAKKRCHATAFASIILDAWSPESKSTCRPNWTHPCSPNSPAKMGAKFQHVRQDSLVNWPSDNSRYTIGIPTSINMVKYGMKNAPEIEHEVIIIN